MTQIANTKITDLSQHKRELAADMHPLPQTAGRSVASSRGCLWRGRRVGAGWVVLGLMGLLFGVPGTRAQLTAQGFHSRSGQFVLPAAGIGRPSSSALETNRSFVRLAPTLLPVSCERIKDILWRDLGTAEPWRGKIFLALYPARTADDSVLIASEIFRDGWQYQLAFPDVLDRAKFVRGIVQTLLLEMANRGAGLRSAEVPAWLTEGFCERILTSSEAEVILPAPRMGDGPLRGPAAAFLNVNRRENPLEQMHQQLVGAPLLSFQQLSWPTAADFVGATGEVYRASAHFFVNKLLSLPGGPACLRAFIGELPQHYNWQFAFLHAFQEYFHRPVEVEKWWTLQLMHFTGRDLAQTWPPDESWKRLDEIIRSDVQVRLSTNDLPLHTEVKLQTIIADWPVPRQTEALRVKLQQLEMVRMRLAKDLVGILDQYCETVQNYLQERDRVRLFHKQAARQRLTQETLRRLDALDHRRAQLQPEAPLSEPVEAALRVISRE